MSRRLRLVAALALVITSPVMLGGDARDPARVAGPPDLPPAARRQGRRSRSTCSSCARWSPARSPSGGPGGQRGRHAHHACRRVPAALLDRRAAEPRQRRCAARWRSSARGRRSRSRSTSTPSASAAAGGQARASPAGRRSTAARRCPGTSGSSSTSGTSSTGAAARPEDHPADDADARHRPRHLQGRDRRMDGPDRDVAVLLTGVGKRYDIVSAFAAARAVDRRRPEPARAGAVRGRRRASCRRASTTPATSRSCEELVRRARRRRGRAADRPRHRGARRAAGPARRSCPAPRSRARPTTSTRRTSCCSRSACRRRRRCCPGRSPSPTR